jgi:secreted trypsin-like serine protease
MFLRSTELQLESIEENNCGVRKVNELIDDKNAPKRIIGRENIRPNESHPWQVSLLIFSNQFKQIKLFCGGALLNQKFIITAAHCVHLSDY